MTQRDDIPAETRIDPLTGRPVEVPPAVNRPVGDADQPPAVVSQTEARQGGSGFPILIVLVVGLVLAGLYFLASNLWVAEEPLPPSGEIAPAGADAPNAAPPVIQPAPAPAP